MVLAEVMAFYADKGAIDAGAINARREFNWWFDAEATRIVLRAPWKKMTVTPIDISVKTHFTREIQATISKANTPITQYLDKYSLPGYMTVVDRLGVARDERNRATWSAVLGRQAKVCWSIDIRRWKQALFQALE